MDPIKPIAGRYRLFRKLLELSERDLMIADLRYGWPLATIRPQQEVARMLNTTEWQVRQAETRVQSQCDQYPQYRVFVASDPYNNDVHQARVLGWSTDHYRF